MNETIRKTIHTQERTELEHPSGLRMALEPGVFPRDAEVEICADTEPLLLYAENTFHIRSTELSMKPLCVSIRLDAVPDISDAPEKPIPFVEVREAGKTYLLPGKLQTRMAGNRIETFVEAECEPFKKELNLIIGSGVTRTLHEVKPVFHPVQHQFKMDQSSLDLDEHGVSRRRDEHGGTCPESPKLQDLYPACYPASWASLCSAYQMIPQHKRRRWEIGTQKESNPPPDETGEYFSTWSMGTNVPGDPPPVSLVTDWRADLDDPTPRAVVMEEITFTGETAEKREERVALIKSVLWKEVGGQSSFGSRVSSKRPVRMRHDGHAWVIVGVDKDGFWEHALATDSWAFSSYCHWEDAPWVTDERPYYISYPPRDCALKPEERRLGCINLEGSSDAMKRVRFCDAYTHSSLPPKTIHWTPHTRTNPGYLWIYNNEPLTCDGFPESPHDPNLGHIVPRPVNDSGHCPSCGNVPGGCNQCRTRLVLPFWVHNTTLNEPVSYRLDLYFWNKDLRWEMLTAKPIPRDNGIKSDDELYSGFKASRWDTYLAVNPLPSERFTIKTELDSDSGLPHGGRWNSQGFAWYIDFHRNQLSATFHGIRLVLTCIQRSGEFVCKVQDIKQLWFGVDDPAPI